jgi:hypothetical protein
VDTNHPKVTKDYYVVRQGQSDRCKIVTGDFGENPVGTIGGAPYASKKYPPRSKNFPNARAERGQRKKPRNTEKNDGPSSRRASASVGALSLGKGRD